jgi:hypothetical protein
MDQRLIKTILWVSYPIGDEQTHVKGKCVGRIGELEISFLPRRSIANLDYFLDYFSP